MTHWETIWSFKTEHFRVDYDVAPDDDLDLSWDDDGATRDGLESGKYVAFVARVVVYCDDIELGADYLGGCIYESAKQFISHRDRDPMNRNCSIMRAACGDNAVICHYFPGMVRCAIAEARKALGPF
jgi:hypothetical protein